MSWIAFYGAGLAVITILRALIIDRPMDRTDALMCIVWPATFALCLWLVANDVAAQITDRLRGRR